MATLSGWIALVLVFVTGLVPIAHRTLGGRRPELGGGTIKGHVVAGTLVAFAAFLHALVSVQSLGASSAIVAGELALFSGGGALFVLMAHIGVGLSLRDPKLKKRTEKRRTHAITAAIIVALATLHAVALWRARHGASL